MKRKGEALNNSSQKIRRTSLSSQEIISAIREGHLKCDELEDISKEITEAYRLSANLLVQFLPLDIWESIFRRLGHSETGFQVWLLLRTVCKSWNLVIRNLPTFVLPESYHPNHVLKIFNPRVLKLSASDEVDCSSLTGLTDLCLTGKLTNKTMLREHELLARWEQLSSLTQLRSLSMESPPVKDATLLQLTNLQSLKLTSVYITEISTLTNLTDLTLITPFHVGYDQFKFLPKLTTITSNDTNVFQGGRGICLYSSGARYEGEFRDGKRHGKGLSIDQAGNVYEGDWVDNKRQGVGTATFVNGDFYNGQFIAGNRHGTGSYAYSSGIKYVGDWVDGKKHGSGVCFYPTGERYEGDWSNEKKHGQGTYTFRDGTFYQGAWRKGQKDGNGLHTYTNGEKYEGEWLDDEKHGEGTFWFADGRVSKGTWFQGHQIPTQATED